MLLDSFKWPCFVAPSDFVLSLPARCHQNQRNTRYSYAWICFLYSSYDSEIRWLTIMNITKKSWRVWCKTNAGLDKRSGVHRTVFGSGESISPCLVCLQQLNGFKLHSPYDFFCTICVASIRCTSWNWTLLLYKKNSKFCFPDTLRSFAFILICIISVNLI